MEKGHITTHPWEVRHGSQKTNHFDFAISPFLFNESQIMGQDTFCSIYGSIATERVISFAAWGLGLGV